MSGTRLAKIPENLFDSFRCKAPTTPRPSGRSKSGLGGTESSSRIVACCVSSFSGGRRIAPSRGPASRPRKHDNPDPTEDHPLSEELARATEIGPYQ
jgi:hypothetical protein